MTTKAISFSIKEVYNSSKIWTSRRCWDRTRIAQGSPKKKKFWRLEATIKKTRWRASFTRTETLTNRPTISRKINFRGSWTSSSCMSRWTQTNTAPKLTSWHPRGSCTVLSRLHSLCSLTRKMRLTTSTWSQTIGKLANFLWNTIRLPKISSSRKNFKKSHLYLVKTRKTNNSEPFEPTNTHKF